ncbi:hypothetical protein Ancab_001271, partial [Ancistrocladus abbreviatus]
EEAFHNNASRFQQRRFESHCRERLWALLQSWHDKKCSSKATECTTHDSRARIEDRIQKTKISQGPMN